jgi:hypothetical protein
MGNLNRWPPQSCLLAQYLPISNKPLPHPSLIRVRNLDLIHDSAETDLSLIEGTIRSLRGLRRLCGVVCVVYVGCVVHVVWVGCTARALRLSTGVTENLSAQTPELDLSVSLLVCINL